MSGKRLCDRARCIKRWCGGSENPIELELTHNRLHPAVTSDSSLPSINTAGIQPSQSILSPEPIAPAAVPNASTSQTSVNTLDAQSDLTSARTARLAEEIDDEDNEEENGLSDVQLRRLYDDEEIERFLAVFAAVRSVCTLWPTIQLNIFFSARH